MAKVYVSGIIDAPVDKVWAYARDFNGHGEWHPIIAESHIEEGKPSDQVGCVRNFTTSNGGHLRERLLTFSDRDRYFTYNIIVSPIFLLIFVFFALLFCLSLWPFVLIGIWSVVYQALQLSWVIRIVAFGVLMLLGWGMYKLREARRDIYGVGEVCVGATMCWFGVNAATADALPSIIAIAGGVYVIVRGLDNCN